VARDLISGLQGRASLVRAGARHHRLRWLIGRDPAVKISTSPWEIPARPYAWRCGRNAEHGPDSGEDHPWKDVYAPGRVPLKAAKNFMRENVTALKSFAEYVAPGELGSLDDLNRGQGAIVRRGLEKIAAYRDHSGALRLNSASCTHVGCHLHWNSFETCWDCPCHGSMFDVNGQPINAPAIGPLGKVGG
jgi:nitrite reductase/ring-hydroxylating ferredoxin subunit